MYLNGDKRMTDLTKIGAQDALMELTPGAGFMWVDYPNYSGLQWEEGEEQTKPTEAAINAKLKEMQAAEAVLEYATKRKHEYPDIGDQLDMIYKDMKNSTTTHADAVEVVKTKWPKNNSGPVE